MWLPMDTAPRNGELILVSGYIDDLAVVDVAWWNGEEWETYIFNLNSIMSWQTLPDPDQRL